LGDFSKQSGCDGGYRGECQQCRNAKAREWYLKNRDRRKKTVQLWRLANQDKIAKAVSAWTKANPDKKSNHYHSRKAKLNQNGVYRITEKELKRLYFLPCFYCGANDKKTQDHVVPIHRGGNHSVGNLVTACQSCNSSKQDKTITEWKMYLQKRSTKGGSELWPNKLMPM
jgi:5-methylcytosine-specific restriction endonuclease McrA